MRKIVFGLLVLLLSGCTLVADDEQKKTVRAAFDALPDSVDEALRVGKVRMHFYNEVGADVGADREIRLAVGTPRDTTLGPWVAACAAMVKALEPTPARLYGVLPGGPELYEGTGDLCERGLGQTFDKRKKPALILGLPSNGKVTDTAINFNPEKKTLETYGFDWRPRGTALPVAEIGALDEAVGGAELPYAGTESATFVVPAGSTLTVTASCGAGWQRAGHVRLVIREEANYLTFAGGPADTDGEQNCGTVLRRPLKPQLSYRTAEGREVDRYEFTTQISAVAPDEAPPSIEVTRD